MWTQHNAEVLEMHLYHAHLSGLGVDGSREMTDDFLNLSRPHEHPWPDRDFPCTHLVQKLLLKKQEAWPGLRGVPAFEKNDRNSVSS